MKRGIERRNKLEASLKRKIDALESKSWNQAKSGFVRVGASKLQLTPSEIKKASKRAKKK